MSIASKPGQNGSSDRRLLRVVTFNIAHGRGLSFYQGFHSEKGILKNVDRIGQLLQKHRADVIALQEIDEDSHWNKNINLLAALQSHTGFEHAVLGVNNHRLGRKPLKYGNAILSRFPVQSWENTRFGNKDLGEKGFLYAEVQVDGGVIVPIINLHLDYKSKRNRIVQIEHIIDWIRERKHPGEETRRLAPIVCGDFNSRSLLAGDAVRHLFNYLADHGHYAVYPLNSRTFPAHWPRTGIDFILLPEPYKKLHCEVLPTRTSDHCPVLLEFEY